MKIYFSATISGATAEDRKRYQLIVDVLESMGHSVIADHVLKKSTEELSSQSKKDSMAIQRKLSKWKKQANLTVYEVSRPSIGVGQEIAWSLAQNIPVVAIHAADVKPHILEDSAGDLMLIEPYTESSLAEVLQNCLEYAAERQDTRFNFFIAPEHQNFLEEVSKRLKLPRAVFLRRLIDEAMEKDEEYKGEKDS